MRRPYCRPRPQGRRGCDRFAQLLDRPQRSLRRHRRQEPRRTRLYRTDVPARYRGLHRRARHRTALRGVRRRGSRVGAGGIAASCGAPPQPLRRPRCGRYRLERQDHSQGVDRFGHAPQCQIRRLAHELQLAVRRGAVAADDRGRRAGRLHRGGHIASGRNGAFGENDTPADNSVHVDRRRPLVELYRPPAADRREARPCARLADHNISRTLRGSGPAHRPDLSRPRVDRRQRRGARPAARAQ